MKTWNFLIAVIITVSQTIAGTGGSNFSRYGLGDIQYPRGSFSMGMAGSTISVLSSASANRLNPAGWTIIDRTRFSIDVYYQGFSIKSAAESNFLSGIFFEGFDMSIPVAKEYGIVVGAGLHPYSNVDYNILVKELATDYVYDLSYVGEGGLSAAHIGVSGSLFTDLHLGAKLNYLFGNINHNIKQIITSGTASSFELYRSTRFYGFNGTFGLIYTGLGKNLGMAESNKWSVGLLFTSSSNLIAKQERAYNYYDKGNLLSQDTIPMNEGKAAIPLAVGFGISTLQNDRYLVAADYYTQNWGESKFFGVTPDGIRNSRRFSIGAELVPAKGMKAANWEKIGLRVGFFYDQTYYKIKGEKINEIGFTTGTDFSIYGDTRLSIGLEYGVRGVVNLQQDKIFRISVGLNAAELWFVRSEEE
jgi:hypothetical protein